MSGSEEFHASSTCPPSERIPGAEKATNSQKENEQGNAVLQQYVEYLRRSYCPRPDDRGTGNPEEFRSSHEIWSWGLSFLLNAWLPDHEVCTRVRHTELVENSEAEYLRKLQQESNPDNQIEIMYTGSRVEGMALMYFDRSKSRHRCSISDQDIMVFDKNSVVDDSESVSYIIENAERSNASNANALKTLFAVDTDQTFMVVNPQATEKSETKESSLGTSLGSGGGDVGSLDPTCDGSERVNTAEANEVKNHANIRKEERATASPSTAEVGENNRNPIFTQEVNSGKDLFSSSGEKLDAKREEHPPTTSSSEIDQHEVFIFDRSVKGLHPGFYIIKDKVSGDILKSQDRHVASIVTYPVDEEGITVHGPALARLDSSHITQDFDFLHCIRVSHWPFEAAEWITRERPSGWPTLGMITDIVRGGCHVVPVGHHTSETRDSEWRLSFSKAEIILSRSFFTAQRKAYLLLKTICKGVSVTANNGQQLKLPSYFLKTVFYYYCEVTAPNNWQNRHIADNLFKLLDMLYFHLSKHSLPNYFIPANNMVDHFPRQDVVSLAKVIQSIRNDLLKAVIEVDEKTGIFAKVVIPLPIAKLCRPVVDCLKQDGVSFETMVKAKLHSLGRMAMHWYVFCRHPRRLEVDDIVGDPGMKLLREIATIRVDQRISDIERIKSRDESQGQGLSQDFWNDFLHFSNELLYHECILRVIVSTSNAYKVPFDAVLFLICAGALTRQDTDDVIVMNERLLGL